MLRQGINLAHCKILANNYTYLIKLMHGKTVYINEWTTKCGKIIFIILHENLWNKINFINLI